MPPDPLLPPDDPPAPAPVADPPARRRGSLIVCEFCECGLTEHGEIIRRGDRAREYLDVDDENKKLRAKIAAVTDELTAARQEIAALKNPPKKPGLFG